MSNKAPYPIVPEHPSASPSDLPHVDETTPFWFPSWGESLRYVGWYWLALIPPAALLGLLVSGMFEGRALAPLWMIGPKLLIMIVALPIVLFLRAMRRAVNARKDPFCIHCGYGLTGLPDDHHCPECGRSFNFKIVEEYRRDPHWFIRRYRTRHEIPEADVPFMAGAIRKPRSRDGT